MHEVVTLLGDSLSRSLVPQVELNLIQGLLLVVKPDKVPVVGKELFQAGNVSGDEKAAAAEDKPGAIGETELLSDATSIPIMTSVLAHTRAKSRTAMDLRTAEIPNRSHPKP